MKYLSITDDINIINEVEFNEVKIYTDNTDIPSGYGIIINNIILTAYHIVHNKSFININKQYNVVIDIKIDEYDIVLLKKKNKNVNYELFLNKLKYYITENNLIKNYNSYKDNQFKLKKEILYMNDLQCDYIKTQIFPPIPVFIFYSKFDNLDFSGYSGSPILFNNNIYGLLISENINTNELTCLPIEIIYKIIKNYIQNNNFYFIPINLKNNIVTNKFKNLNKNTFITKINDIELNNNLLYDINFNDNIPYDTYILLNGLTNIKIEYYKNIKYKKIHTINIKLICLDYKYFSFNFRNLHKYYVLKGIIFSELSEEKIIEMSKNNIVIPTKLYDVLYNDKKLIYIKDIVNTNLLEHFINNNINIFRELYIIKKVSGQNIKNINKLQDFIKFKNITFELLNSNMDIVKIKI